MSMTVNLFECSPILHFIAESMKLHSITQAEYHGHHHIAVWDALYNPNSDDPKKLPPFTQHILTYIMFVKYLHNASHWSWPIQKGRRRVRLILVMAPDHYILDIQGPSFADSQNNHAVLVWNELSKNDLKVVVSWFYLGDIFFLDRGYCDGITELQTIFECGEFRIPYLPSSLINCPSQVPNSCSLPISRTQTGNEIFYLFVYESVHHSCLKIPTNRPTF